MQACFMVVLQQLHVPASWQQGAHVYADDEAVHKRTMAQSACLSHAHAHAHALNSQS